MRPPGFVTVEARELVMELDDLGAWIADVKKIFAAEMPPDGGCLLGYVWLQFGAGTDDYLASTSGMRAPVHAITMLTNDRKVRRGAPLACADALRCAALRLTAPGRLVACCCWSHRPSHPNPLVFSPLPPPPSSIKQQLSKTTPARGGYMHDLVEQLSLCKYKGRPHFGKSTDRCEQRPGLSCSRGLRCLCRVLRVPDLPAPPPPLDSSILHSFHIFPPRRSTANLLTPPTHTGPSPTRTARSRTAATR